jgi:hypothetical protein
MAQLLHPLQVEPDVRTSHLQEVKAAGLAPVEEAVQVGLGVDQVDRNPGGGHPS